MAIDRAGDVIVAWSQTVGRKSVAAEHYAHPRLPAAPSLLFTTPASPADDNSPRISGTAPTDSTVDLFTNSACSGEPVASGSGAQFDERAFGPFPKPGIEATIGNDTTTGFYATATEGGETSSCSGPLTYTELADTISMPEALADMAARDPLTAPEDPLSRAGTWTALSGAAGPGFVGPTGWGSHRPFPALEGAAWTGSTLHDSGTGVVASARLLASPGVDGHSFSLWLDMPSPAPKRPAMSCGSPRSGTTPTTRSWSAGRAGPRPI